MSNDALYKKGDVIGGKYEIRGVLGAGGFGVVYLVHDRELEELFALKTFRDELLANPKARTAFKKESLLWVNLGRHPHILAARWVSEISGRLFVSMDYIAPDTEGRVSLHNHLVTANGPLDMNQVLGWAIQFCLGMEHGQANGLKCHRDIKPGNILIAQDWALKIADFGLATAAMMAWGLSSSHCDSSVTATGETGLGFNIARTDDRIRCGTPGYMSPEVYRYEAADIRSDVYSFGVVLWQMVSGSQAPPWTVKWQGNMENYLRGIYEQQMAGHLPLVQDSIGSVIRKCLHVAPSKRFSGFQELRSALESVWQKRTGTMFTAPQIEESPGFWCDKGAALNELGQHEEAIKCFDKTLKIEPSNNSAWNNKGSALDKLGRHEEAVMCFNAALAICPQDAFAWNNKGAAFRALGQHEEAVRCYDKALVIDPRQTYTLINKGMALNYLGRHEEAVRCLDKALLIDPRLSYAWNNKTIAFLALGRYKEAIDCSDKALAIDPQYAAAWNNKGKALSALGWHEEAIQCLDKALVIDPQLYYAWNNKAIALDALGRHEEAVGCYDKALVINPREENAWYGKALSEDGLGRSLEAIRSYQKFIEFASVRDAKLIADVRQRIRELESKGI
jgi:tetratricopeptide (TPR) repeat protein